MKLTVAVGAVELTLSGADLTVRQAKDLLRLAASIALALPRDPEPAPEPGSQPIGFTASVDLDPGRHLPHGPDWYDDED